MEVILQKIEESIENHLKELQLELSDIEYIQEGGYNYLRVYVEKEEGNTNLDDCVELSQKIDGIVDELIKDKFFLEVSTPGIERKLKKAKDFIRFLGENIKVYSKNQIEGKKVFEGKLKKFENEIIYLDDIKLNKLIEIPLTKLKKANIVYKMPNEALNSEEE